MSKNALKRAAREPDQDLKARFLSMATGWHILAEEIEKANGRITTMQAHYQTKQASQRKDH
jgi:aldehyde:ferredoxin oxidoreductase